MHTIPKRPSRNYSTTTAQIKYHPHASPPRGIVIKDFFAIVIATASIKRPSRYSGLIHPQLDILASLPFKALPNIIHKLLPQTLPAVGFSNTHLVKKSGSFLSDVDCVSDHG